MPLEELAPRRFDRAYKFMNARFSRDGVLGLYLTIGVAVVILATWWFGGISEDVITGDPLVVIDLLISEWLRTHATAKFTTGMQAVSSLASATWIVSVSGFMAVVLAYRRLWYWLGALMSALAGGMVLNILLKIAFDRPRPGWADSVTALTDPGFPSGHTMMATIAYGYVAVYLILIANAWRWRACIAALTIGLILAVALSRMYLGAHYLSDVMAAMAAGLAWLAFCLTSAEVLRRRRRSIF